MPLRDALAMPSSDQAVTAAAVSETYYQKAQAAHDLGAGRTLYAHVVAKTALTDGGSNTGTPVYLVHADNAALTSNRVNLLLVGTFAQAAAAGTHYEVAIPAGLVVGKLYVGAYYDPQGANLTGGTFDFWIDDKQLNGTKEFAPPNTIL